MAQNFLACDRDQELLLPPNLRDWLDDDHLAWLVLDVVETIDLSAFYGVYRRDGHGRAAHDPAMMVALLLYSYAVGERSSRRIERRCSEDVASRVICANLAPDHSTIARFRARHQDALAATFTQILELCCKAGLVSVGVVALDGTSISGNCAAQATRSYVQIRDEVDRILGEAAAVDEAEDAEFGESRGDELPTGMRDRRSRLERLNRCREELEAEQTRKVAAYDANLKWRADWETEHGRKLTGRKPYAPDPDGLLKSAITTTDPDSRSIIRTGRPKVQGYNAQAVATTVQIIVAADVTQQAADATQLEPMISEAAKTLQRVGAGQIETVLADGGYWNGPHMDQLATVNIDVIVPTRSAARTTARKLAPKQGPKAERIDRLLATPQGKAFYTQRQHMIETVFANTKFNRGIRRFQRRGLEACRAEWRLIAATHNLLKLHTALKPA